jgi:hypothetical protein
LHIDTLFIGSKNFGGTSPLEDALILGVFIYFLIYILNLAVSFSNISNKNKTIRIWNSILALPFILIVAITFYIYIPMALLFAGILLAQFYCIYLSIPAQKSLVQTENNN